MTFSIFCMKILSFSLRVRRFVMFYMPYCLGGMKRYLYLCTAFVMLYVNARSSFFITDL